MLAAAERPPVSWAVRPAQLGVWMFLAVVTMLFAAFSSALLIRRAATDWAPIALPGILWVSTAMLVASSATLELARGRRRAASWLSATLVLGLLFVFGQLLGWRQLAGAGVLVPTSPHASFFYILTGLHAVHLLGGIVYLVVLNLRVLRPGADRADGPRPDIGLCATYWHFMGALWIYLFALLAIV